MLKTAFLIAATAAVVVATPAQADEARVEARAGVAWALDDSEAVAGIAAGYDFDLGETAFAGVEVSGDKALTDGAEIVWGFTGRAGAKIGAGKLFAAGGYSAAEGPDAWHLGAGYEHKVAGNVYLKAEYRHFLVDGPDADTLVAGVGVTF